MNKLKLIIATAALGWVGMVNAQDTERLLQSQTWYGDNMGFTDNNTATKKMEYLYGKDNQLVRRITTGLLENGDWLLTNYYRYTYTDGKLLQTNSVQYGLYDQLEYGFSATNDTVSYEYNANGLLAKEYSHANKSWNEYEYDEDGNVVKKTVYKNNKLSQTITYSDFTAAGPQAIKAEATADYNCYDGTVTYNEAGKKVGEKHWNTSGALNYAEYWNYNASGELTSYEKKGISGGEEVNSTKVEYEYADGADRMRQTSYTYSNGEWKLKGGSIVDNVYSQYAKGAAPEITDVSVDSNKSKATVTFTGVSGQDEYRVFRNGLLSGTVTGSGTVTFTDENVPNGEYEYFVVSADGKCSEVMTAKVARTYPRALDFHATTATYSSEEGYKVHLAWTSPNVTDDMKFVNMNVVNIGKYYSSPLLDAGEEITNPRQSSVEIGFGIDAVRTIYLQTRYEGGTVSSDTITIDATAILGKVEEENKKLRVVELWGDAMGNDTGITKKTVTYYGSDNREQRIAEYAKTLGTDGSNLSDWTISEYTVNEYGESGMLEKQYTQQYGRYDYGDMGFREARDTTYFEHDVEGNVIRKENSMGYVEYEYSADGSLVKEHSIEYANPDNLEQTITYSDFAGKNKPKTTKSSGNLTSFKWVIETVYEGDRKINETKYTWKASEKDYVASQYEVFEYDETGELRGDTVWTVKINNDILNLSYKSVTSYEPEEGNPNRIKVVKKVWDNILKKFGNPKTWNVNEYTDIDAAKYSPVLSLEQVAGKMNTVQLIVDVPEQQKNAMTALNIYRNGIEIAHGVSYMDDKYYQTDDYGMNGKFVYVDEKLRNGNYDYFVEFAQFDAAMENEVQQNNISNVERVSLSTLLPKATALKEVSRNETTSVATDSETGETLVQKNLFVTLDWEAAPEAEAYGLQRYNVMVEGMQIAENSEADGKATTYELDLRGRDSLKVYIQTVFDYGYSYSDTILVTEKVQEPEEPQPVEPAKGVITMKSPANYQVIGMSHNGEWACGVKYDESADENYGFRWNLVNGKIEMLGIACTVYTVSDDGTVAGSFTTTEGFTDGKKHEAAATWKDGVWTVLEQPNNYGSWAYAITPDGQYVTGTDNKYKSYIWKNGKIENKMTVSPVVPEANGTFITYSISPDGQMAGGWAYYHDDNRNAGYWSAGDKKFHALEPSMQGSPWQAVKKFSDDSKKMLFWGGYHQDSNAPEKGWGIHAIYDIETQDTTYIYPINPDPFNFDFFDMSGDAKTVVGYQQDDDGTRWGIIWNDGETQYIEDYLRAKGAEFSDEDIYTVDDNKHLLDCALATDAEAKTFALLYYDPEYNWHTMIVALDRAIENTPAVNLEATQVQGVAAVALNWDEPLGKKDDLKGYDVYRDGSKINTDVIIETEYIDNVGEYGTYTYYVTAVYENSVSDPTGDVTITLQETEIKGVRNLAARQKGYNGALVIWDAPESNLSPCTYVDETKAMDGFGGGTVSFESGTLFPAERMALYDGYKLAAVSFVPGTEQGGWIVNVYTHNNGKLTTLSSTKVSQELKYGEKNIVYLPKQIALQKDHDLLIGIQTNVTNESYDVQKVYEGCTKVGYTDLLRVVGDADFFSVNEAGATEYDMAWTTTALLAAPGVTAAIDSVDYYSLSVDGVEAARISENEYVTDAMDEGDYSVSVETVYKDGRKSAAVYTELTVAANPNILVAVEPTVTVSGNMVSAQWDTPKDNDPTQMGYCADTEGMNAPAATESVSEFIARVDFTPKELRTYGGYEINSLQFFPLSDASFELSLYEDDEIVATIQPENLEVGDWNTVKLSEPIIINKGKTYRYLVDCYDCAAGQAPLAIDGLSEVNDYSSYIMSYGESSWYTVYEEAGISGNWLMRMDISDPKGKEFAVSGYDVYADNKKHNETIVVDNVYELSMPETEETDHNLRVDTYYSAANKKVQGKKVYFELEVTSIEEVESGKWEMESGKFFNIAGQRVNKDHKGLVISKDRKRIVK